MWSLGALSSAWECLLHITPMLLTIPGKKQKNYSCLAAVYKELFLQAAYYLVSFSGTTFGFWVLPVVIPKNRARRRWWALQGGGSIITQLKIRNNIPNFIDILESWKIIRDTIYAIKTVPCLAQNKLLKIDRCSFKLILWHIYM